MTDPNHIAEASKKVSRPQIREVFLRNGFTIKPGRDDLHDYVYEAAFELLEMAAPAVQGDPDVPALADVLTSDLSARINRVSKRSLDGSVVMYSEEWNGIVELVKKLLCTAPQPAHDVQGEPVAYLRKDQLRQVQRMGPMLGEIADSPRADRVPVYAAIDAAMEPPK